VQISTLQSTSALTLPSATRTTSIDATTLAFISTWETASMASTASSHTPFADKLSAQNLPNRSVENSTTKTTAPKETDASFPTISATNHAYTTQWGNANSATNLAAIHTQQRWMLQCHVFSTLWEGAKTIPAKTSTTTIT